jgi:hypothetical protein
MNDIQQLETALEIPPSAHAEALAASIAARLLAVPADAPLADRARTVRGLIALSHHYYRIGNLATAGSVLAATDALSHDLDAADRVAALLRRGEFELLTWDVGAALDHTSTALQIAHAAGLRLEEVHVWINYGMALQATGLWRQADVRLAYALNCSTAGRPRLRNIWALRSLWGFHGESDRAHRCTRTSRRCATEGRPRDPRRRGVHGVLQPGGAVVLRDDGGSARQCWTKRCAPQRARGRW